MPLDSMDRENLGFTFATPKIVNDEPVAELPDGRKRSPALIAALSTRDYTGSHRSPEQPITDPYADRAA